MKQRHRTPAAIVGVALFAAWACNGTEGGPPASTDGFETECDTDAPPVTSGGTYGPQWQFGDAETGEIRLDVGGRFDESGNPMPDEVPPMDIVPDDDPVEWTFDEARDTFYRSPTALELEDNDWLSPTDLFVVPPSDVLRDLSAGLRKASIPIPMYDQFGGRPQEKLAFRTLPLVRTGTKADVPFIEQRWEGGRRRRSTFEVSFSLYASRGFDPTDIDPHSIVGSAISSSERDSLAIIGATRALSFSMRGPYGADQVRLELPTPSGTKAFYMLKTEFDPVPGQLFVGSAIGEELHVDPRPTAITTHTPIADHNPESCFDGVENDDETDIDCGGEHCPPCGLGEDCLRSSDCSSRFCVVGREGNGTCASQCADGLDNDADGFADGCDFNCVEHPDFGSDTIAHAIPLEHAKTVGLFGTMDYCTVNENAYLASFVEWSSTMSLTLNNIIPDVEPADFDPSRRPPPFVVAMRGCFVAETTTISSSCDTSTPTECPDALSDYPFFPISTTNWSVATRGTNFRAWNYVDYVIEDGDVFDTSPIQVAAIITPSVGINSSGQSIEGLAISYTTGLSDSSIAGALSVNGGSQRTGLTIAHETGHTVGLAHDSTAYPGTAILGIMAAAGGVAPVLDWDADSDVGVVSQGVVWQTTVRSKSVPRASGFGFQGCVDDIDCQNGHPGLSCSPTAICVEESP